MVEKTSIEVYTCNERVKIQLIYDKIRAIQLNNRIENGASIVDDCSKDDTKEVIHKYISNKGELDIRYFRHKTKMAWKYDSQAIYCILKHGLFNT